MSRSLLSLSLLLACSADPVPQPDSGGAEASCRDVALGAAQTWEDTDLLGTEPEETTGGNAGVGLGDLNGDGWLDALVVTPQGSLALTNDGTGGFVGGLVTVDEGLLPAANGVALGDVDGDGDLDAWLGRLTGSADLLLFNDGAGHFTSSEMSDSESESFSAAWGDVDADGDLDLIVARYADSFDPSEILDGSLTGGPTTLYLGDGSGALTADEDALPDEVLDSVAFAVSLVDLDGDGDLDAYLANDFGPFLGPNRLLENDGSGRFSLVDEEACFCNRSMYAMGIAAGDLDGNAAPDLYLTDLAGPDLLLNEGGAVFYEATLAQGAEVPNAEDHLASWGTAAVDLDRDGWLDLPMVFGPLFPHGDPDGLSALGEDFDDWVDGLAQHDVLLRNTGGGVFTDISESAGFTDARKGRALAVGDLDRDGRPDLLTAGLWYAQSWHTEGGCANGITLRLTGAGLVAGLGAHVVVEVDGVEQHHWFTSASTWSSHAPELTVGLGETTIADRITVSWTDGRTSEWTSVAAGELEISP